MEKEEEIEILETQLKTNEKFPKTTKVLNEIMSNKSSPLNKLGIVYKEDIEKMRICSERQTEFSLWKIVLCWKCARSRHTRNDFNNKTCYKCKEIVHKPQFFEESLKCHKFWRKKTSEDPKPNLHKSNT